MRAFLKFLINIWLIALLIWLVARFTTLDDKIISFFADSGTKISMNGSSSTQSCNTPRGVTIPNGSSIFAYQSANPDMQWQCYEEERQCIDGVLKWSYEFGSCNWSNWWVFVESGSVFTWSNGNQNNWTMPAIGASCTTPWWQSIAHGNYIVSYESPSSCRFQRRMCVDGQLFGKFQYNYCMIAYRGNAYAWESAAMYEDVTDMWFGDMQQYANNIQWDRNSWGGNAWGWSWQYTPVNYGWQVANRNEWSDAWNSSKNGSVTVLKTSSEVYNPLAKNGTPSSYVYPKEWRKSDYTKYDLSQKWCTSPWWTFIDHGQYVIGYRVANASNWRSCEYERRSCFNGKLHGSFSYPSCTLNGKTTYTYNTYQPLNNMYDQYYRPQQPAPVTNKSCRTPRGTTVKHWDYSRAYKYSSAPYSDGCQWEIRYCHNWVLDGSFGNQTCTIKQPSSPNCYGRQCWNRTNSCNLPWWWTIGNGQYINAYRRNANWVCETENRYCSNWFLQWSYNLQSCSNTQWSNTCSLPWWWSISNWQSVVAYQSINWQCYSQSRFCYNGNLNWSYSQQSCSSQYQYGSCSLPRWWSISHGQSVTAYQWWANWECFSQTRFCYNGNLNWSYSQQSCNSQQQGCYLPWWWIAGNWQTVTAYSKSNWQCYSEWRFCYNGRLNWSYTLQSCTPDIVNYTCSLPWWWSISNWQSVEAFLNSTSPCTKQIRYCSNWVLNGSYTYASCTLSPWGWFDTYGWWESIWWYNSVPDWEDTCHGDAVAAFTCQANDVTSCVDYRKIENDCCIEWRAKYEKRTVTCVQ